jgi:hypothetical protein
MRPEVLSSSAVTDMPSMADLIKFVADETRVPARRILPSSSLQRDLHVDGDDAFDLMKRYAATFHVDMTGFDISQHFGPEASLIPAALLRLRWWRARKAFKSLTIQDLKDATDRGRWVPGDDVVIRDGQSDRRT